MRYGDSLPMRHANTTAQLVALPFYLGDADLARRSRQCWNALSAACHAHPYELAPTAAQLSGWLDVIDELVAASG